MEILFLLTILMAILLISTVELKGDKLNVQFRKFGVSQVGAKPEADYIIDFINSTNAFECSNYCIARKDCYSFAFKQRGVHPEISLSEKRCILAKEDAKTEIDEDFDLFLGCPSFKTCKQSPGSFYDKVTVNGETVYKFSCPELVPPELCIYHCKLVMWKNYDMPSEIDIDSTSYGKCDEKCFKERKECLSYSIKKDICYYKKGAPNTETVYKPIVKSSKENIKLYFLECLPY